MHTSVISIYKYMQSLYSIARARVRMFEKKEDIFLFHLVIDL